MVDFTRVRLERARKAAECAEVRRRVFAEVDSTLASCSGASRKYWLECSEARRLVLLADGLRANPAHVAGWIVDWIEDFCNLDTGPL